MAERFPSIEDIDAGQAGGTDGNFDLISNSADTSDFLTRERAALGDDADQFSSPQDNVPKVSVQDGDDDLLGGGGSDHMNGGSDDMMQFQSNFPAIDTRNERVAPGGTITGSTSPYLPGIPTSSQPPSFAASTEEPSVLRDWRERRSLAIQHREDAAADRKASTISAAQTSIDEFYDNYNNKKERSIAQTRKEAEEFLAGREDTTAGGTSWERIAKLVDVRGAKGAAAAGGKERFRELLGALVKDENAPGAKGY